MEKKGTKKILALKLNGFNKDNLIQEKRPIRKDIIKFYKDKICVICGSKSNLVCDHKNDLYNDSRVLNLLTQKKEDFQCLCNHCNLQKRQIAKKERENKELYLGRNLEEFKNWPCKLPDEINKKIYNKNDKTLKNETFWFDPISYREKAIKLRDKYLENEIIKKIKEKLVI